MKSKLYYPGFILVCLMFFNQGIGQVTSDSILARSAYRSLVKAGIFNGISLTFGIASNIEMAAIGGFPLESDHGQNATLNISHAIICGMRLSFSIYPPIYVSKARMTLKPWLESPEKARSCKKLFAFMDAAQVLTAAAPVLSVAGGIMMVFGAAEQVEYNYPYDNHYTLKHPALKTAGWIFVGAGLAASISAAWMIGHSKRELSRTMGSLKLTAGPAGIGMIYNMPVR